MDNNLSKISELTEMERSQQWENCSVHQVHECSGTGLKYKMTELSENQKGKSKFDAEEPTVQWEIRNNHCFFHILHFIPPQLLRQTENNAEKSHSIDQFNDKTADETHC